MVLDDSVIVTSRANPELAGAVAAHLGIALGACTVEAFPDGEISVWLDEPVRRREVFVVQSTSPPVNDNLMELLALVDACRRSSAARITAIVPYFGYARSDKRHGRREPIMASLVASLLQTAGVDHLITVDPHSPQIEGFFRGPVDSLLARPTPLEAIGDRLEHGTVVVAPDTERVKTATEYAERLGMNVVVVHKQCSSGTETAVTHVVGEVEGRPCLIVDDMISTGGTIVEGVAALREAGASPEIYVAATHAVFAEGAEQRLRREELAGLFVTDTVRVPSAALASCQVVSIAPVLAEAVRRVVSDGSFSSLYL